MGSQWVPEKDPGPHSPVSPGRSTCTPSSRNHPRSLGGEKTQMQVLSPTGFGSPKATLAAGVLEGKPYNTGVSKIEIHGKVETGREGFLQLPQMQNPGGGGSRRHHTAGSSFLKGHRPALPSPRLLPALRSLGTPWGHRPCEVSTAQPAAPSCGNIGSGTPSPSQHADVRAADGKVHLRSLSGWSLLPSASPCLGLTLTSRNPGT